MARTSNGRWLSHPLYPPKGLGLRSHTENCRERCLTSKSAYEKQRDLSHPQINRDSYSKRTAGHVAATQRKKGSELAQRWSLTRAHGATTGRRWRRGFGAIKISDAVGKLKAVRPDGNLVRTARALGICFGD